MGYKLAGFDVIGGVEIDPKMMAIYRSNHRPKFSYLMGVQEFNKIEDLPPELFDLDILDGSPPCSSFSVAGARERKWGKESKFREGQSNQILDDLFFHFISVAEKLKPKVIIAENVKGLVSGRARGYVKQIFSALRSAGYVTKLYLLDASRMGVPQKRIRTFFISQRMDRGSKILSIVANEPPVLIKDVIGSIETRGQELKTPFILKQWRAAIPGLGSGCDGGFNSYKKCSPNKAALTQTANHPHFHWGSPNYISDALIKRIQSFPDDFNFLDSPAHYVCGMSVPPFMMQRIADQVAKQWLIPGVAHA